MPIDTTLDEDTMRRLVARRIQPTLEQQIQPPQQVPMSGYSVRQAVAPDTATAPVNATALTAPVSPTPQLQIPPPTPTMQRMSDLFAARPVSNPDDPHDKYLHPGKLKRLGAILSGVSTGLQGGNGAQVTREALEAPYNRDMARWQAQMQGLEPLVRSEQAQQTFGLNKYKADSNLFNAGAKLTLAQIKQMDLNRHNLIMEDIANTKANKKTDYESFIDGLVARHPEVDPIEFHHAYTSGETIDAGSKRRLDERQANEDISVAGKAELIPAEEQSRKRVSAYTAGVHGAESRKTAEFKRDLDINKPKPPKPSNRVLSPTEAQQAVTNAITEIRQEDPRYEGLYTLSGDKKHWVVLSAAEVSKLPPAKQELHRILLNKIAEKVSGTKVGIEHTEN